ncbi:hypothetical protein D3C73_1217050 [compost metagenome]
MNPDQSEYLVHVPFHAEQISPEDGYCDAAANQRREVKRGSVEADSANFAVQHNRDQQGESQLQRNRDEHEDKGYRQRFAEYRVMEEDPAVIIETYPPRAFQQRVVGK